MQAKQEFALLVAESSKAYQEILQQQQQQRALAAAAAAEEQRRRNSWPKQQQVTGVGRGGISYANPPLTFQQQQQQAYLQQQQPQQQRLILLQQEQNQQHHQRQLQFQEQKQHLLQQQQQLQQQIYKQRIHAASNPSLNVQARFSPPEPQQQALHVQVMQTPQERGANAISMVKSMNQNNAATTASNWNYTTQHAASTGRLSLF